MQQPNDLAVSSLVQLIGVLFLVFAVATLFDIRNLFSTTVPLAAIGILLISTPYSKIFQQILSAGMSKYALFAE